MMSELDLRDRHSAPLSCTSCRQVVRVSIDRHATGNLTIKCPNCGHNHYRYCKDGVITEDRWRSSAQMIPIGNYSTTATADNTMTYTSSGTATSYLRDSWHNTDSTGNW